MVLQMLDDIAISLRYLDLYFAFIFMINFLFQQWNAEKNIPIWKKT